MKTEKLERLNASLFTPVAPERQSSMVGGQTDLITTGGTLTSSGVDYKIDIVPDP